VSPLLVPAKEDVEIAAEFLRSHAENEDGALEAVAVLLEDLRAGRWSLVPHEVASGVRAVTPLGPRP